MELLLTQESRLFKPAYIASLDSFQDGGLQHNNPLELALWECPKIWGPDITPNVLLSLGTGKEDDLRSPKAPDFRHILNDGFIPRLCRSFMSSLDGERAWKNLANRLDRESRGDYFRLNVLFVGDEPRLDDVGRIEELRNSVHLEPEGPRDRKRIALAILVTSFYFELSSMLIFELGKYLCTGVIRCRNSPRAVLHSLNKHYGTQLELITAAGTLGMLTSQDVCSVCHLYCKRVHFYVHHLEEVVSIQLRVSGLERRKLSGFPNSMEWFL